MSSDAETASYILSLGDQLYKTFGFFIIVICTIGNLCNCFVFLFISPLNKHPNALFLVGAAIGSLLFINVGLWTNMIRIFTGFDLVNRLLFFCKITTWLTYAGGCFSFMCYCFAGLCQFVILSPNPNWQRLLTRTRAKSIIISTATIYILIFSPLLISNTIYEITPTISVCKGSIRIINLYTSYCAIVGYYFLPALLTLVLFGLTWYNFQQFLRRQLSIEGVVTRMMLIQMSSILLSGIPTGIFVCYMLMTQS
ncbi:unnamed protein product, partial [Adineta ricciae]